MKLKIEGGKDLVDSSNPSESDESHDTISSGDHVKTSAFDQMRDRLHSVICELQYANGKAFHFQAEVQKSNKKRTGCQFYSVAYCSLNDVLMLHQIKIVH